MLAPVVALWWPCGGPVLAPVVALWWPCGGLRRCLRLSVAVACDHGLWAIAAAGSRAMARAWLTHKPASLGKVTSRARETHINFPGLGNCSGSVVEKLPPRLRQMHGFCKSLCLVQAKCLLAQGGLLPGPPYGPDL